MAQSATKFTHKKKNYNKKELAKKLDRLAEKVSSKNIFVVSKSEDEYTVLDYKTQQPVITEIPNKLVADKLCDKSNRKAFGTQTLKEIKFLISEWHRYKTEILFFKFTIDKSPDQVTVESARHRLDLTNARMKNIMKKLMTI
jgi:hypothetical protein